MAQFWELPKSQCVYTTRWREEEQQQHPLCCTENRRVWGHSSWKEGGLRRPRGLPYPPLVSVCCVLQLLLMRFVSPWQVKISAAQNICRFVGHVTLNMYLSPKIEMRISRLCSLLTGSARISLLRTWGTTRCSETSFPSCLPNCWRRCRGGFLSTGLRRSKQLVKKYLKCHSSNNSHLCFKVLYLSYILLFYKYFILFCKSAHSPRGDGDD